MQPTNNTNTSASVMSGKMTGIELPPLSAHDMDKLDQLLSFMKENKTEPVDVYRFCKTKWDDNRLLYLFFAEYLKKNSFTSVQNYSQGSGYAWQQMIAPEGLAFDGFKKEYIRQRQRRKKKKEIQPKSWYLVKGLASLASFCATCINLVSRLHLN